MCTCLGLQCVAFAFLPGPDDAKVDSEHLKRIPLPPNGAQVPNPIQPQRARDQAPARPVHHRQSESLYTVNGHLELVVELIGDSCFNDWNTQI